MRKIKISLILSLALFFSFHLARAQDLEEEAKKYYEKGKEYYSQAKYKEAEEEFQKALSLIAQKENKPVPIIPEYVIGYDDVLYLTVWQDKDLSQEVTVQPDGRINFPLAGDILSVGLTITQVKKELTERLKEYIKNPVISLALRKVGGSRAIILGQIGSPGVYDIRVTTSVLELIALAKGFTSDAAVSSTILIRGAPGNPRGMRLNLTRAIDKAALNQNIRLLPGDIVYIPKKFIADVNYFVSKFAGILDLSASAYEDINTLKGN